MSFPVWAQSAKETLLPGQLSHSNAEPPLTLKRCSVVVWASRLWLMPSWGFAAFWHMCGSPSVPWDLDVLPVHSCCLSEKTFKICLQDFWGFTCICRRFLWPGHVWNESWEWSHLSALRRWLLLVILLGPCLLSPQLTSPKLKMLSCHLFPPPFFSGRVVFREKQKKKRKKKVHVLARIMNFVRATVP